MNFNAKMIDNIRRFSLLSDSNSRDINTIRKRVWAYYNLPISFSMKERFEGNEIMDDCELSYNLTRILYRNLNIINFFLQVNKPAQNFVKKYLEKHRGEKRTIRILDVGHGYGGKLRSIAKMAKEMDIIVEIIGVELNEHASLIAKNATKDDLEINYIKKNVYDFDESEQFDIVLFTQVLHHLKTPEIEKILTWATKRSHSWFCTDLFRSQITYYAWVLLTHTIFLPLGAIIRTDGALSIRKSFRKDDFNKIIKKIKTKEGIFKVSQSMNLSLQASYTS